MAMTLGEAEMIFDGWIDAPPAHLVLGRIDAMLAAWLGAKRTLPLAADNDEGRAAGEALALMPGIVMGPPVKLPEDNVFDFDALQKAHIARKAAHA